MTRQLPSLLAGLCIWGMGLGALSRGSGAALVPGSYRDFNVPPHSYFERTPTDAFSRHREALEGGQWVLDRSSERAFLVGLLSGLGIPVSSQMLVFSTTSLQLSRITPATPRALYFSDDLYLGYIPGGRIEVAAVDPDLGAVFYIFDIPRGTEPVRTERSTRCMNCHANEDTGHVPGLVIKSVVPGPSGGSLDSFRRERTGHAIPFAERFGGWYLTGQSSLTNHWGNTIGRYVDGALTRVSTLPGERADLARYPMPTSDLLPQLVHEHQVGFVNRAVGATYRARTILARLGDSEKPTLVQARELDGQADLLVRYLLFTDEVGLPAGGIPGDEAFKSDYAKGRKAVNGISLRDLELRTRLYRYRCSPMIYGAAFAGLPTIVKERVLARLVGALADRPGNDIGRHLPAEERRAIRGILEATVPEMAGRR